ncbi:Transmembrane protein [Parasponia andersonii]|uniref:Transmembrane protein n=1 Tax=Parasponia andersonii TaxID=3476 RepID=A0A2P5CZR8_PARAD|nr:Transmembrane protein [Parasponia andersonii]
MKLAVHPYSSFSAISKIDMKSQEPGKRVSIITSALPETAASIAIAATVIGAAATLLVQRNKANKPTEVPLKTCEDCGGSGVCSECKGEGFVLKKLSEENAERARLTAKNMATRYTAALPKKWSYCTKCSSARSCSMCGGSGKTSF